MDRSFLHLLDYLASAPKQPLLWNNWSIQLIDGGANNLIYRARNQEIDLAIKWTIRDQRLRAEREYAALMAIQHHHPEIAPTPLLIEQQRYQLPVIIQTWIEGTPLTIPQNDQEWQQLITHYTLIHSITPATTLIELKQAVVNANSPVSCWAIIEAQYRQLPPERIAAFKPILEQFKSNQPPSWPKTPIALCRVDANPANFIQRPNRWASVDWENSGWGDPAFEMAELMAHPEYRTVNHQRWNWVIATYGRQMNDSTAPQRIWYYYQTMLVWWVIRLQRMIVEIPQGHDQRLVERPMNWQADLQAKYNLYYERALQALRDPPSF